MEKIWKGYPGGSYDFSNLLQFYFFISLRKPKWSALLSNIWIAREAEKGCRHSYAAAQMWARLEMSFGQQISQRVNQSDCDRHKFQSRESKLQIAVAVAVNCILYTPRDTGPRLHYKGESSLLILKMRTTCLRMQLFNMAAENMLFGQLSLRKEF